MNTSSDGDGGVIFINTKVGDLLYFENLGKVIEEGYEIGVSSVYVKISVFNINKHQSVDIKCTALINNFLKDDFLRNFIMSRENIIITINFNKIYYKPVRGCVDGIYFESDNKMVSLEHLVLVYRKK